VIFNGLILAASRGAFLGVLFGGLVLSLVKPPQYRRLFWAFAAVGVVGAVSLMDQRFIDRMFSIEAAVEQSEDMDGSAQSRWVLMQAQVRMFADHPMGVGHKGTVVLSPQYLDRRYLTRRWGEDESAAGRSSHNTFLTLLVEQSLPGVAVYLAFVLWGVAALLTLRRRLRTEAAVAHAYGGAALSALGVVLAAGMFTDYLMAEVQIWMTALLAAQLALRSAEAAAKIAPAGTALQAAPRG
jgi:O-antigen ligase